MLLNFSKIRSPNSEKVAVPSHGKLIIYVVFQFDDACRVAVRHG